ncbi:MAG: phosphate acyltransferase [Sphaerochaetaceae bacterium]
MPLPPTVSEKLKIIAMHALNLLASLGISKAKVALIAPRGKSKSPHTIDCGCSKQLKSWASQTDLFGDSFSGRSVCLGMSLYYKRRLWLKHIDSPVAADADLLVMDNLDAANALYKAWTMVAHVKSSALVIGAQLPIVLTSRSDEYTTRVASLELALKASE